MDSNTTTPKKLKRKHQTPEAEENDEARKRGRPRVDAKNESAADRRRTQIRLAQRAYRQRKESTLDELRRQVTDLQDTIKSMNRSFQEFSNKCVSQESIVPTHLVSALKHISKQYATLVNSTLDPSEDLSPPSLVDEVETRLSAVNALPSTRHVQTLESSRETPATTTTNVWGYQIEDPPREGPPQQASYTTQYDVALSSTANSGANIASASTPRPLSRNMTIGLPYTYSFQETTFARRLHRASLELAYRLSCDPSRNPSKFDQVFKLWLNWAPDIKVVQDQFRAALHKSITEPLSLWHFPLSHIGGAGTHYPRQEVHGGSWRPKPNPDDWSVRLTSAPTLVPGTSATDSYDSQRAMLDTINTHPEFQGEWLDAYDVEGYLAEKGIIIDPQSSFADVEMPQSEVLGSERREMNTQSSLALAPTPFSNTSSISGNSATTSNTGSVATRTSSVNTTATTPPTYNAFSTDFGNYSNMAYMNSAVGYSDSATGSFINMNQPRTTQPYISERSTAAVPEFGLGTSCENDMYGHAQVPLPQIPQTKLVTIDVAKLIMTLARSAWCLGRTPGYRRHQIDIALRESIIHDL